MMDYEDDNDHTTSSRNDDPSASSMLHNGGDAASSTQSLQSSSASPLQVARSRDTTNASIAPVLTFDIESYASRYHSKSETLLQRLLFIADMASSAAASVRRDGLHSQVATTVNGDANNAKQSLQQQQQYEEDLIRTAYKMAERHLKERGNTRRYREVFGNTISATSAITVPATMNNGTVARTNVAWGMREGHSYPNHSQAHEQHQSGGQNGGEESTQQICMDSEYLEWTSCKIFPC